MATALRENNFGYSGPVHKWARQPVLAGEAGPREQLTLLKWVKTGARPSGAPRRGGRRAAGTQ
jgi:hypothetical protein